MAMQYHGCHGHAMPWHRQVVGRWWGGGRGHLLSKVLILSWIVDISTLTLRGGFAKRNPTPAATLQIKLFFHEGQSCSSLFDVRSKLSGASEKLCDCCVSKNWWVPPNCLWPIDKLSSETGVPRKIELSEVRHFFGWFKFQTKEAKVQCTMLGFQWILAIDYWLLLAARAILKLITAASPAANLFASLSQTMGFLSWLWDQNVLKMEICGNLSRERVFWVRKTIMSLIESSSLKNLPKLKWVRSPMGRYKIQNTNTNRKYSVDNINDAKRQCQRQWLHWQRDLRQFCY